MKFAFIFPGQGSQSVGMLNAFADHAIVRETVEEASDALRLDLSKLISEGPTTELNRTTNTQPIMLTTAYAIYRAWKQQAGSKVPAIVAGHSLGEYTALTVAGALAFHDAILLVHFRAEAMQSIVPIGVGGMAAILGLDDNTIRAVCSEASTVGIVEAVNFNAPGQVVIAGHTVAIKKACELARAIGAKRALLLSVSAPFHSSLLKPAANQLREYLKIINVRIPQIAVINNIDGAIVFEPAAIRDALVRQVAGPVHWVKCVKAIAAQSVTHLIECGPGKVLTRLTKHIDSNLISEAMNDPTSLNKTLKLIDA